MSKPQQLVQGLLFIVEEQQRSISQDASSSASRPAMVYILLPSDYSAEQPLLATFFEEKSVLILNGNNVSRLLPHVEKLRVLEIFLHGSPKMYGDYLCPRISAPYSYRNFIYFNLGTVPESFVIQTYNSALDAINILAIERLLSLRPDIPCHFCRFKFGECSGNLLHLAALSGHARLVRSLLDHGANICSVCTINCALIYTPLHLAVMGGSDSAWEVCDLIIRRGADVNAKDSDLRVPLHYAERLDVVEILLENGTNVNHVDNHNCPPLLEFLRHSKEHNNWFRVPEGLRLFLKYGALIDAKYENNPCLHWVLSYRDLEVFQFILESSTITSSVLSDTPLHEAIKKSGFRIRNCFSRHLVKVVTLLQLPAPNNVVASLWADKTTSLDDFRRECESEITRLKSEIITNTTTSLFDVLSRNEYKLCCLLRNESIARGLDSLEPMDQFPQYGKMFIYHLDKGKNRKLFQECGGKSLDSLSLHFKELPDDIKDMLLRNLNITDLLNLKRAKSQLTNLENNSVVLQ